MDPSISLVSCGEIGVSSWDYTVLQKLAKWVDYHSIHMYTSPGPDPEFKDVSAKARYERNVFGPAGYVNSCWRWAEIYRVE
jgi:alpha-N-arabinofuranosidase